MGEDTGKKSNIASHIQFKMGDTGKGFAASDIVVEREFTTAMVHQGYIEPHNTTVIWKNDGTITVWVSTQGPFQIRAQLSEVSRCPSPRSRLFPAKSGVASAGSSPSTWSRPPRSCLIKTGHPVKMVMSRSEVFEASGPAPGTYTRVKMGGQGRRDHRRRQDLYGLRGRRISRVVGRRRSTVHSGAILH